MIKEDFKNIYEQVVGPVEDSDVRSQNDFKTIYEKVMSPINNFTISFKKDFVDIYEKVIGPIDNFKFTKVTHELVIELMKSEKFDFKFGSSRFTIVCGSFAIKVAYNDVGDAQNEAEFRNYSIMDSKQKQYFAEVYHIEYEAPISYPFSFLISETVVFKDRHFEIDGGYDHELFEEISENQKVLTKTQLRECLSDYNWGFKIDSDNEFKFVKICDFGFDNDVEFFYEDKASYINNFHLKPLFLSDQFLKTKFIYQMFTSSEITVDNFDRFYLDDEFLNTIIYHLENSLSMLNEEFLSVNSVNEDDSHDLLNKYICGKTCIMGLMSCFVQDKILYNKK